MCQMRNKDFMTFDVLLVNIVSFSRAQIFLDFGENQVEFSKPLKSGIESDDSRTQKTWPMQEFWLQVERMIFNRNWERLVVVMWKPLRVMVVLLTVLKAFLW